MGLLNTLKGSVFSRKETTRPVQAVKPAASATHNNPATPDSQQTKSGVSSQTTQRQAEWKVLFVGDDPRWFSQTHAELERLQPDWFCQHALDFCEAEAAIENQFFDALVVDGRVPNVDNLLAKLEDRIDRMICLVRCDVLDRTTVAQWNRSGMTPVSGDADAVTLAAAMRRLNRLRAWMADPAIKKLLPLIRKLPTQAHLHGQITDQLQSPNASIQTVALLISQDPVMSAKILQVVNSAFFGLSQEVTDTAEAVMVLGTERIRSLILLAGVFSQYGETKCLGFSPEPIWGHSLQVAMFARAIAFGETKDSRLAETAFTAGLLHDIGKLVLVGNVPEMYDTVQRMQLSKKITQCEAEALVLGTTHAILGACLLATWGLPLPILEAIAWHHTPEKCGDKGFSLLAAVHVANVFAQENGYGNGDVTPASVKLEFLMKAGLGDCLDRWREICGLSAGA